MTQTLLKFPRIHTGNQTVEINMLLYLYLKEINLISLKLIFCLSNFIQQREFCIKEHKKSSLVGLNAKITKW